VSKVLTPGKFAELPEAQVTPANNSSSRIAGLSAPPNRDGLEMRVTSVAMCCQSYRALTIAMWEGSGDRAQLSLVTLKDMV
jgi:hypothetical protein